MKECFAKVCNSFNYYKNLFFLQKNILLINYYVESETQSLSLLTNIIEKLYVF